MQTYRRFVSYVYQYENGKKAGNRGFIKVEAKGNTCNIQISLKGICKDENTACSVYGFKREDGLLKGSLLAECPVKAGVVREHLVLPRNEMGRAKYGLQELNGIIFQGNDKTMYGTQWDDDPMKMENFQPDERNEELTDSGSGFAEEKAEGWQNTSETPAGEWLTDSERIPEEMAVEREPLVETPENSTLAEPQWEDQNSHPCPDHQGRQDIRESGAGIPCGSLRVPYFHGRRHHLLGQREIRHSCRGEPQLEGGAL